ARVHVFGAASGVAAPIGATAAIEPCMCSDAELPPRYPPVGAAPEPCARPVVTKSVPSAGSTTTLVGHHEVGIVPAGVMRGGASPPPAPPPSRTSNTPTPFMPLNATYNRARAASYAIALGPIPVSPTGTSATTTPAG